MRRGPVKNPEGSVHSLWLSHFSSMGFPKSWGAGSWWRYLTCFFQGLPKSFMSLHSDKDSWARSATMRSAGGAVVGGCINSRTWSSTGGQGHWPCAGEQGDRACYVSALYSLCFLSVDIQSASPPATMPSPSTATDRLCASENVKQNNPVSSKGHFILATRNQPRQ